MSEIWVGGKDCTS